MQSKNQGLFHKMRLLIVCSQLVIFEVMLKSEKTTITLSIFTTMKYPLLFSKKSRLDCFLDEMIGFNPTYSNYNKTIKCILAIKNAQSSISASSAFCTILCILFCFIFTKPPVSKRKAKKDAQNICSRIFFRYF